MTKAEFVQTLKERAEMASLAQAEAAYSNFINIVGERLEQGDTVIVTGLGSFKIVQRKARKGRNPRTGKEIAIPASKNVKFTPSKKLKDSICRSA